MTSGFVWEDAIVQGDDDCASQKHQATDRQQLPLTLARVVLSYGYSCLIDTDVCKMPVFERFWENGFTDDVTQLTSHPWPCLFWIVVQFTWLFVCRFVRDILLMYISKYLSWYVFVNMDCAAAVIATPRASKTPAVGALSPTLSVFSTGLWAAMCY